MACLICGCKLWHSHWFSFSIKYSPWLHAPFGSNINTHVEHLWCKRLEKEVDKLKKEVINLQQENEKIKNSPVQRPVNGSVDDVGALDEDLNSELKEKEQVESTDDKGVTPWVEKRHSIENILLNVFIFIQQTCSFTYLFTWLFIWLIYPTGLSLHNPCLCF